MLSNTLLWVDIVLNAAEGVVLLIVVCILVHWVGKMVAFTELMNEMGHEEERIKSRMEEWDTDIQN